MVNLAGFDFIFELSRTALQQEILKSPLIIGPNGEVLDTLLPPFSIKRDIPMVGSTQTANFIIEDVQLFSVPRSASIQLLFKFDKTSFMQTGLGSISMLSGQFTVNNIALQFDLPGQDQRSNLMIDFTQCSINYDFDVESQKRVEQAVGATQASLLVDNIKGYLASEFRKRGRTAAGFSFTVIPGVDSTSTSTLTGVPSVLWIDSETLGFFGYHRQGASTGDISLKNDSDLDLSKKLPVAVLVSPDGFRITMACPAMRNMGRDEVGDPLREKFLAEERAKDGNTGNATKAENSRADNRVNDYINSPAGRAKIVDVVPAPCGTGQLPKHVDMPNPFPATTAYINWLEMRLGNDRIDVFAKAHADVFCGSIDIELPMWMTPTVAYGKVIPGPLQKGNPSVRDHTTFICAALVAVLSALLIGVVFAAITTFLFIVISEAIVESLSAKEILKQDIKSPGIGTGSDTGVAWFAIQIEPSGLSLRGTWPKASFDPQVFKPQVKIISETISEESQAMPEDNDIYHDPGSSIIGCPSGDFEYFIRPFETTIKLRIESQDVPLPLTMSTWSILIGRKPTGTDILNGNYSSIFSGSFQQIVSPRIVSSGDVLDPFPPLSGSIVHIDPIEILASGSDDTGWELKCRPQDRNLVIMVDTNATDAGGRVWHLRDYVYVEGRNLTFGPDYYEHANQCGQGLKDWINRHPKFAIAEMNSWTPIWDPEIAIAYHLYDGIKNQKVGSISMLQEQIAELGEGFVNQVLAARSGIRTGSLTIRNR